MSDRRLSIATLSCGLLAVVAAALDAPAERWWIALPGLAGAAGVLWRPTRWLGGVVGLSALALAWVGRPMAYTAVLVGSLVLGFVLLVDLLDDLDQPDRSVSVPAEDAPARTPWTRAPGVVLAGWARCVVPAWLVGAGGAAAVAVAATTWRPAPEVVAIAPLVALVAGLLAVGAARNS